MPKISVVIPVYNVEKYLSKCLDSVIAQTLKDIEIICVDDCSTDGSLNILQQYAAKDDRIKILKNETNSGAAVTRNNGMDAATGEYIYFIDSDDWIDNDYLEKMVAAIERTGTDIVLNLNIESNGEKYVHRTLPSVAEQGEFIDQKKIIDDAPVSIWARLYRKSFLDKYHVKYINMKKCEDVAFHYITQIRLDKVFVFFGPTYHYIVRKDSLTDTGRRDDDRDFWDVCGREKAFDYFVEHNIDPKNIKLFQVMSYFQVNTSKKFDLYKQFFTKIRPMLDKTRDVYNDLELFFADIILECVTFEEYQSKYGPSVTMNFIRRKK